MVQLKWLRIIIRINQRRIVKKFLECKLEGTRRVGTPRFRRMKDAENDIRELKVKTWKKKKKILKTGWHQGTVQQRSKQITKKETEILEEVPVLKRICCERNLGEWLQAVFQ
jgi:hypothetical protein